MSLESCVWNWEKIKQKYQLQHSQGTVWGQMPERSEGSLGQKQQEVVGQVLAGEVLLCSPSPKIGLQT